MIEFLNEAVRNEFHLLSADVQREWNDLAAKFIATGQVITILGIEHWGPLDKHLEIAVRIDKKFDPV